MTTSKVRKPCTVKLNVRLAKLSCR